jgi:hypothetical protein
VKEKFQASQGADADDKKRVKDIQGALDWPHFAVHALCVLQRATRLALNGSWGTGLRCGQPGAISAGLAGVLLPVCFGLKAVCGLAGAVGYAPFSCPFNHYGSPLQTRR